MKNKIHAYNERQIISQHKTNQEEKIIFQNFENGK